jgi:hypothetical protein
MTRAPTILVTLTLRSIAVLGLSAGIAAAAGCGQVLSEEGRGCPCASGWTCCNEVCVVGSSCCPKGVDLGSETVPGDMDASAALGTETVSGFAQGVLQAGQQVSFDYSTSIWPEKDGFGFQGWLITAAANEELSFQVWASPDAGQPLYLPLVTYGPLGNVGTGNQCTGAANAPVMQPSPAGLPWTAGAAGMYLVVPYHEVSETVLSDGSQGLAFQGFNDPRYADAFLTMQQPGH